ncbi:LacI family DNA-binding transcriptional regulator [Ligilactobacillus ceti]|uniref:Maltose operon transcriptional repressor n=1 Tax=Ligilactobacillus ceti DSM 22408 TaxID=1122146 RepID=A0A0R2KK67_9LACO|nr:LacI family DNA-binding transcriptional regulator [Ligilactobacillus ceti]KRN89643.1 maltose operon transcriptional repressor [Ligilactobacillus ceti DSM 22408]
MTTIKDVAKLAGVSPSTASRALHNSSLINSATRQKVLDAVEALDYTPNFAAQNLASKRVNTIGVILPVMKSESDEDLFYMQIMQGIVRMCNAHGYTVSLATGKTTDEVIHNVESLSRRGQLKRFIFVYSKKEDPVLEYLKKQAQVKYVVVGAAPDCHDQDLYSVDNDNVAVGQEATEFLLEKGYQNICYVYTDLNNHVQAKRYRGYQKAMKENDLPAMSLKMQVTDHDLNVRLFNHFMQKNPDCHGFVIVNDLIGIRMQQVFDILSLNEKQYGLITFDNTVLAELARPTLTSVELFPHFLGTESAALAMSLDQKESEQSYQMQRNIIVPHRIMERLSTPEYQSEK